MKVDGKFSRAKAHLNKASEDRHQNLMDLVTQALVQQNPEAKTYSAQAHNLVAIAKPTRENDRLHDGALLGTDGLFSPLTDPSLISPLLPNNGAEVHERVIYLNGIMTDVSLQQSDMQALANTGVAVIGIHNSTLGFVSDMAESLKNKLDIGSSPAIDTLCRLLAHSLDSGDAIRIVGHSQGAILVANALKRLHEVLDEAGIGEQELDLILSRIHVETFGGAAQRYIDGPKYTHFINKADVVPMLTGVGFDTFNPFGSVGRDAKIKNFVEVNAAKLDISDGVDWGLARYTDAKVHGARDVYFKHRLEKQNEDD